MNEVKEINKKGNDWGLFVSVCINVILFCVLSFKLSVLDVSIFVVLLFSVFFIVFDLLFSKTKKGSVKNE